MYKDHTSHRECTNFSKTQIDKIWGEFHESNQKAPRLFEIKFDGPRSSDAWAAVNKSIKTILDENRKKEKPFDYVFAAGITFTGLSEDHSIKYYQAKLFAVDGNVIEKYQSENLWKFQSSTVRPRKQPLLFLRDDLFNVWCIKHK